jgi:hypothetical protein
MCFQIFEMAKKLFLMLIFWQILRRLRVPITSRMLTDILYRLVETTAEEVKTFNVM